MTLFILTRKKFLIVSHKRLAVKLQSNGITSKLHKCISSFLFNRLQWVKVGTSCSNKCNVINGVPQGSILGPILFAIYINDLSNCLTSQCKIFADDIKIYHKSFNHDIVQMDINNMVKWPTDWCFYFNIRKYNVLHTGEKNTNCDYFMSVGEVDYKLNNGQLVKDLRVTLDPKLNHNQYIYMKEHTKQLRFWVY